MTWAWSYDFDLEVKRNGRTTYHSFYGTEKKARIFVLNNILKGKAGSAIFWDTNDGDEYIVGMLYNEGGKWYYCDAWNTYRVAKDGSVRFLSSTTKVPNDGW